METEVNETPVLGGTRGNATEASFEVKAQAVLLFWKLQCKMGGETLRAMRLAMSSHTDKVLELGFSLWAAAAARCSNSQTQSRPPPWKVHTTCSGSSSGEK